jgi:hypothetical protein
MALARIRLLITFLGANRTPLEFIERIRDSRACRAANFADPVNVVNLAELEGR